MNNQTGSVVFRGVEKKYGTVTALKKQDFEISPGKLVTLLGPSGCGKTTTLRLIAGLENPTSGKIIIGGQDVTHLSATYRNVSMVFQSYALFPHMSVLENVSYGLTVKKLANDIVREKAEKGLEMVGLKGFGDRLPSELSGGQQQRVAVARAIVLEPEVLLLDEPLSNLDAKLRRFVREEIRQIQLDLGLTAAYVTHDQEEAMAVSDEIIVMKSAEIAQVGTPRELYERPNSSFIADFIGDANLITCDILSNTEGKSIAQIGAKRSVVMNPLGCSEGAKLVLRPNDIELNRTAKHSFGKGVVEYAAYLGSTIQYTVKSDLGELFVVARPTDNPIQKGDEVFVSFDTSSTSVVPA